MIELDLQPFTLPGLKEERPMVITGPCSAESEEQVLETAKQLSAKGFQIFRAGIWKPRTRPNTFEGVGEKGLPWLKTVKQETGMYTSTEVANAKHVYEALKHGVDILWVGARTTANPFAVQEIADALQGVDIPVAVKNPINPDLELWIGGIERIYQAGIRKIAAIHRGFSTYDKKIYRNIPQWHIPIELRRRIPQMPIICDPSHIGGKRELIAPISQEAMDLNFNGLIIESHICPEKALSDAKQQVTPDALKEIIDKLVLRDTTRSTEDLSELRKQIDELDTTILETLAQRMRVAEEIGTYKKEHNMTILQSGRYSDILADRVGQGVGLGLGEEFMGKLLRNIHEESIRHQNDIMNK